MNTRILGGIIILLVVIVGVGYFATQTSGPESPEVNQDSEMENPEMNESQTAPSEEGQNAGETTVNEEMPNEEVSENTLQEATAGAYLAYSPELVANSNADKIVLFFHADWCPSCRALDRNIISNADDIPADVEIYKVDYDQETALRQQYGIVRQHSVLTVSSNGEATGSVFHPSTLSQIISSI